MPSPAHWANMASTAAKTVPVATAACATTSQGSATAQLASADAGKQLRPLADRPLNYHAPKPSVKYFKLLHFDFENRSDNGMVY